MRVHTSATFPHEVLMIFRTIMFELYYVIFSFSLCFYFSGQILSCWLFGTSWIKQEYIKLPMQPHRFHVWSVSPGPSVHLFCGLKTVGEK